MIGSVAWITEKLLQAYMHMNLEKMELNCICYGVQCGITDRRESYRTYRGSLFALIRELICSFLCDVFSFQNSWFDFRSMEPKKALHFHSFELPEVNVKIGQKWGKKRGVRLPIPIWCILNNDVRGLYLVVLRPFIPDHYLGPRF